MVQLVGNGMQDGICVVSLFMNFLKVIKFDSIVPLPVLAKRRSRNGFTFEDNFDIILRRMNRGNTRTILKMLDFEKICLKIDIGNNINILYTLFGSKGREPNKERKVDSETLHVTDPFLLYLFS